MRVEVLDPDVVVDDGGLRAAIELVGRAGALVGVHGAGLVYAAFLRPGSALVEVTLRAGWCCWPLPFGGECGACERYHKADFHALAGAYGLRYYEHRGLARGPAQAVSWIGSTDVWVNGRTLRRDVGRALREWEPA